MKVRATCTYCGKVWNAWAYAKRDLPKSCEVCWDKKLIFKDLEEVKIDYYAPAVTKNEKKIDYYEGAPAFVDKKLSFVNEEQDEINRMVNSYPNLSCY